ncbi:hypothetical protein ACFTRD_03845 [Paenibacillus sp. NPDC056933]|uniref:hypothetical protein n=1 Tax=Paenibacillus sp. NPDC056933 TaxID=3345968 RepID=UPI003644D5B3
MNTNISKFEDDLKQLIAKSDLLYYSLINELNVVEPKAKKKLEAMSLPRFKSEYEVWYSESLAVIKLLLPDRLLDFSSLYKNEKRKEIDFLTYTISDYMIGLRTTRGTEVRTDEKAAVPKFEQQRNILKSVERKFSSSLFDIKQIIQADFFDDELETAEELNKKGFIRGAGAIAGVILEKHLKQVANNHDIKINKKNPGIGDFNDLLKNNEIFEVPTWRFIQHLGDIRNLCDHNKEREPLKEEVTDLISGVRRITKTIF